MYQDVTLVHSHQALDTVTDQTTGYAVKERFADVRAQNQNQLKNDEKEVLNAENL
jgi:hypothetical protein